ncbi:unnamed protein product, partial [Musa hybrid cultivar]
QRHLKLFSFSPPPPSADLIVGSTRPVCRTVDGTRAKPRRPIPVETADPILIGPSQPTTSANPRAAPERSCLPDPNRATSASRPRLQIVYRNGDGDAMDKMISKHCTFL